MRPGNQQLDSALRAGERSAAHSTRLGGLDVTGQITAWTLDRAYSSDLPAAMRAVQGTTSAQLDLTLTGRDGRPGPALYGPAAPHVTADIARPGQSVTHTWGVSGQTMPAFRGTVRSRSAQSGADAVQLAALDGAERLRQPARLPRPDGGIQEIRDSSGTTRWSGWAASPVWVVSHLLRQAGIHTAPPPRERCILYAPLHGGAAAGVGSLDSMTGPWDTWTKTGAPHESAVVGGTDTPSQAVYVPETLPVNRTPEGLWCEVWVDTRDTPAGASRVTINSSWALWEGMVKPIPDTSTMYLSMHVDFDTGQVTARCGTSREPGSNAGLMWTDTRLTQKGRWHVGWWFTWSDTGIPSLTPVLTGPGGELTLFEAAVFTSQPIAPANLTTVELSVQNLRAECLQVSQRTTKPEGLAEVTQAGTWTRAASLDTPRFPLKVLPSVTGTAWDVITEIAASTLATAEFDSNGFFRWRDHTRWVAGPKTVDVTVTSSRELAKLTVTEEIDACRNQCSVKWGNWDRVTANKYDGPTEKLNPPKVIPPGGTETRIFPIPDDMYDPATPRATDSGYRSKIIVRKSSDPDGYIAYGALEITLRRSGGVATLTMTNRSQRSVFYFGAEIVSLSQEGDPVPSRYTAWNTPSQAAYGVQTLEHDAKGWLQDQSSGRILAEVLRNSGALPIPVLRNVEILPDPRIELGDVVRVVDTTGAELDMRAWVVGIRTSADGGRITQSLTLRGATTQGFPTDTGLTPDPPTDPTAGPPV
ncbi:hypothetical protein M1P56_21355 [Streptomyces sp. HU2014]|uniref:hypothetical protein n=1 Tax=Streptomyces sp. HU2014 TaxID=2939414 RepID=UPI00200E2930|nr:hypothetical protein [Streptomyces sp. HU2014]UQI46714.1 hypothetical protein M1P56_21355 [Streptomyces sp. HU2014]